MKAPCAPPAHCPRQRHAAETKREPSKEIPPCHAEVEGVASHGAVITSSKTTSKRVSSQLVMRVLLAADDESVCWVVRVLNLDTGARRPQNGLGDVSRANHVSSTTRQRDRGLGGGDSLKRGCFHMWSC